MNKYFKPEIILNVLKSKIFGGKQCSYSQCGEDLILNALLSGKKRGFYVDIGSNDVRRLNNTYFFYKRGWRGINVEPNISKCRTFNWFRSRDINLNVGVAQMEGEADFYSFHPDTLSTFSKEVADEYQANGYQLKQVQRVQLLPLSRIFERNLSSEQSIDFMTVDTEGYDIEVLKSNNWELYRPAYIILESLDHKNDGTGQKLNATMDAYMSEIGYEIVADTYLNSIYKDSRKKQA